MGDLTVDELSDLRKDLGDDESPYTFTDAELHRLHTRADDDYSETKLLALEQLLANAAKFYDYVSGFTRQEQEAIFDHLMKLYDLQLKKVNAGRQVQIVALRFTPPRVKEEPLSANDQKLARGTW